MGSIIIYRKNNQQSFAERRLHVRKANYGFGWSIDSVYGKPVYQHGGGIFGFTSNILSVPEENICIMLFDNKGDGSLEKIAAGINAILHNKPYELPKERVAIATDTALVKQYWASMN